MIFEKPSQTERKELVVVDAGKYEVTVNAKRKPKKNGDGENLLVCYHIREDVEQPFKGEAVFEFIAKDKKNPDWFDMKKLAALLYTQENTKGFNPEFGEGAEGQDEYIQYINGIHCTIEVTKEYDSYRDDDVNKVVYLSYRESEWDKTHPVGGETAAKTEEETVTSDDIWF